MAYRAQGPYRYSAAPIGADLAGLLVITAVYLDVPLGDLAAFEATVFDGHVSGSRDVGGPAATDAVRMACAAQDLSQGVPVAATPHRAYV